MKKATMRISNISQFLTPFLLLVLLSPQVSAQWTWTFEPELERLTILPEEVDRDGQFTREPDESTIIADGDTANISRSDSIYLGLYVRITETGTPVAATIPGSLGVDHDSDPSTPNERPAAILTQPGFRDLETTIEISGDGTITAAALEQLVGTTQDLFTARFPAMPRDNTANVRQWRRGPALTQEGPPPPTQLLALTPPQTHDPRRPYRGDRDGSSADTTDFTLQTDFPGDARVIRRLRSALQGETSAGSGQDPYPRCPFPESGTKTCRIFVGALELPANSLPDVSGVLTITYATEGVSGSPTVDTSGARRTDTHSGTSTVTYNICPMAGCPFNATAGFAETSYDVTEGQTVSVTATLSMAAPDGGITLPLNYPTGLSGPANVVIAAGMTTSAAFDVMADQNTDDAAGAPPEVTELTLGYGGTGVTLPPGVTGGTTTIRVTDDDDPAVTVAFGSAMYSVPEGGMTAVTVVLSATPEREVVIPITTTLGSGTTASDFSGVPANVTFAAAASAGDLTQTFNIMRAENDAVDPGKSVALSFGTLPAGVMASGTTTATAQLADNDGQGVALSIVQEDQRSVTEGAGAATITVTATLTSGDDLGADLTVDLALMDGSAVAADYTAGALPDITFSSGATNGSTQTATITVTAETDNIVELDETIMLGTATGTASDAAFGVTPVTITLIDNNTATLSVTGPSAAVDEGGTAMFTLGISDAIASGLNITVGWSGGEGGPTGTVTLMPDMTSQTFEVTVPQDSTAETGEMFTLTLVADDNSPGGTNASKATVGTPNSAMVAVTDDDNIVVSLRPTDAGPADPRRRMEPYTYTISLDDGVMVGSTDLTVVVMATATVETTDNDAENADYNFVGEDAAAEMITVTIPMGQSSQTFQVMFPERPPVTGDQVQEEGDETLVLQLMNPMGGGGMDPAVSTTDGSITITITEGGGMEERDEVTTGTLVGIGRIISSNMVGAIDARASASLVSGPSRFTLAGKTFSEDMVRSLFSNQYQDQDGDQHSNHELLNNLKDLLGIRLDESNGVSLQPVSVRELLTNSSFELSLNGKKKKRGRGTAASGNTLSFWGRGAYGEYESQSDEDDMEIEIDGDTLSGQLGIDYRFGEWLTGVALNYTDGSSDFKTATVDDGEVDTELYSVHPYVHYSPANSPLATWLMLGYGQGDLEYMEGDDDAIDADIDMLMVAAGLTYKLASTNNVDWSLKTNGFFAEFDVDSKNEDELSSAKSDVTQLRMAISAGITRDLTGGDRFNANFDVGGRFDSGDAEEGAGAEIAGGLNYVSASAGLDLAAEGRFLVAHEESDFDEWGASVSLRFDPGIRRHGLQMSLLPAWGNSSSGVDTIYESKGADSVLQHSDNDDPEMRMETRVAYGFPILRDDNLLTPYVEMENASQSSSLRLGKSLEIMTLKGMSFKSDVYGVQESHTGDRGFVLDSRLQRSFAHDAATLSLFGIVKSGDVEDEDYQIGVELNSKF